MVSVDSDRGPVGADDFARVVAGGWSWDDSRQFAWRRPTPANAVRPRAGNPSDRGSVGESVRAGIARRTEPYVWRRTQHGPAHQRSLGSMGGCVSNHDNVMGSIAVGL